MGPMALPLSLLFMLAALVAATYVGKWTARRREIDVEPVLWQTLALELAHGRATALGMDLSHQEPTEVSWYAPHLVRISFR